MPRNHPYSPEVRERAVRMFVEHRDEYPSEWAAMTSVATKLGMTPETLRSWVRRAEVDGGRRPGLTTDERQQAEGARAGGQRAPASQRDLEGRVDFLRDRARRSNEEVVRYIDASTRRSMGSRADLQGAAVRSRHVLRREGPPDLRPVGPRRGAEARDRPGPRRERRRLRGRQGLDPAQPGGHRGGPLHR